MKKYDHDPDQLEDIDSSADLNKIIPPSYEKESLKFDSIKKIDNKLYKVFCRNKDEKLIIVNAAYMNIFTSVYPQCTFHYSDIRNSVVVLEENRMIGLIMPMIK